MTENTQSSPQTSIDDFSDDFAGWPNLQAVLTLQQEALGPRYKTADSSAVREQRKRFRIITIPPLFGTVAVLFAVIQLSHLFHLHWLESLEIGAALVALIAVVLETRSKLFLLERNKAERVRMLKFRSLLDPALFSQNTAALLNWTTRLQRQLNGIEATTLRSLLPWAEGEEVATIANDFATPRIEREILRELVDYFVVKRLDSQLHYFRSRAQLHHPNTPIPHWLFLGSIIFALAHFVFDIARGETGESTISTILIVMAVSLPVVEGGIRNYQAITGNSRFPSARLFAVIILLEQARERLLQEIAEPSVKQTRLFKDMWLCEQVLESEHREWLRSMLD